MQLAPSLPEAFQSRMESMLEPEYPAFLASYEKPRRQGLRINTLKISPEDFLRISPFPLKPVPWAKDGFYCPPDARPSRHPFYRCGLYYLQEPSAMAPAALLPIRPGDRVLDLCAAPGGKATQLGSRLNGKGILVANDPSNARAKALLRNLELFGIANAFVTNESPVHLAQAFPEFFDKILVDAPCSGEGMFRKEPAAVHAWSPDKPEACSRQQREILSQAIQMLSPKGLLMYSTCTFAPIENEGTVSYVLENFPDMELLPIPDHSTDSDALSPPQNSPGAKPIPPANGISPGSPLWGNADPRLSLCGRIWPHRCEGEGHFLALFRKRDALQKSRPASRPGKSNKISRSQRLLLEDFFRHVMPDVPAPFAWERVEIRADKAFVLPEGLPPVRGLRFLRNGLFLGELKKNRFEPSQPLALALTEKPVARLDLPSRDARIGSYLKGESIQVSPGECAVQAGWLLLCADSFPLGWGKLVNGILKNKYPAGWRCHSFQTERA